jgi:hypothetical protein
MDDTIKVSLAPHAGFCVKSSCLQDGIYAVPATEEGPASTIAAPKGDRSAVPRTRPVF